MTQIIEVYTDGACRGNPGPGGWGVLLIDGHYEKTLYGGELNTTNNRMELTAAIKSILYLENKSNIQIYTDSKYLKDGIESWIHTWKKNGWKTSNKKQVKNKDLWIELDEEIQKHNIKWNWVKGHANDEFNEKADFLARKFIEENS